MLLCKINHANRGAQRLILHVFNNVLPAVDLSDNMLAAISTTRSFRLTAIWTGPTSTS
jgi:hypothetical protein